MTAEIRNDADGLISGFKPFYLITFLIAAVWVGVSPVLIPAYVLSVTGSATDVALVLSLMALGAFGVPLLASRADRARSHRSMQMLSLLLAASYMLLGFTDRPIAFAVIGMLAGLGLGASNLVLITYYLGGGYSDHAQASALARGSRTFLFGQVSGGLLIAAMLAADVPFELMFVAAGLLPLIAMGITWFTTKPLEERLHATMDRHAADGSESEHAEKVKLSIKDWLLSPFGRVMIGIFLVYAGWAAINGQYANYFFGAFGIEPEVSAAAAAIGALLGVVVVGSYAKWFSRAGGLPQFNFHALMRVIGGFVLVGLALVLVEGTGLAVLLPMLVFVLLYQLNPVQDIAYVSMAARTAIGGAAAAQGMLAVVFAVGEIVGVMSAGAVADGVGWEWVPMVMVALAGLGLILGLSGRKLRDQLVADAAVDREASALVSATVPDIHMPPQELMESDS